MSYVLSLFDGMSCGMISMKNAGIHVEQYDAYEIDKYAIKTSTHNFPEIKQHGDVFSADFTTYNGYDYLIGGSPCTYWSAAQQSCKRERVASGTGWELFSQYVRALREAQPKMFIYENNKGMSKDVLNSISGAFGFEPICINSALVSAQNRKRLYWVGVRQNDGTYRKVDVKQPEDRKILLKDILDDAVPLSDKSHAVTATEYKGQSVQGFLGKHRRTLVAKSVCVASRGRYNKDGGTDQHIEVRGDKTNALTTVGKDNMVMEPAKIFILPRHDGAQTQGQAYRVYSSDGKSTTLKATGGGIGARTGLYAIEAERSSGDCIYHVQNGQIVCANGKSYPIKIKDGFYRIRKLTVDECKRLQTVPEWYDFSCVSKTQAYKMLGNGWTCDVITHLIKACLEERGKEL